MTRMNFAPLRYVLAIVRFPKIMQIERHVASFQEAIRHLYPLDSVRTSQGLIAQVGPEGVRFEPVSEKVWQFAEADRSHALILGSDFILVHAGTAYEGHEQFLARLRDATSALASVKELGIKHVSAIGYRFIDLIEPRADQTETVAQYLEPWALPTASFGMGDSELKMDEAAYIASFRTPIGLLRFQALRRPQGAFPPELATPFVRDNGWIKTVEAEDFVLLDIDHYASFENLIPLDSNDVHQRLEDIHVWARRVFEGAATPFAFATWERDQ